MEKSFFHILDIRKEAPLSIHVQVFIWTYGFIFYCSQRRKPRSYGCWMYTVRNSRTLSKVIVPFSMCTNDAWEFQLLQILTSTWYDRFLNYSNGCLMISYCDFNLHFPKDEVEYISMNLFAIYVSLLERHLFRYFAYFFLLSCLFTHWDWRVLYIL